MRKLSHWITCNSSTFVCWLASFVLAATLISCGAPALPPSGTLPPNAAALQTRASAASAITIQHLVLIKLKDTNDRTALEKDCNAKLPSIPGVVEFSLARPIDIGRKNVDGDYDVAVSVEFASTDAYKAYLVHPDHLALVGAWKEKSKSMRIFDYGN